MLEVADELHTGRASVPFIGRANAWVEDTVVDRSSLGLTQWLVQQAILHTHAGQLEVIVFDDTLSGLSAPFESLNDGGEKLLRTVHETEELAGILAFLRDHVQGVNNVVQGMAPSLMEFRRAVDYPVESYKLVVLSTDISLLDEHVLNQISILLRSGPCSGVTFVIHSVSMGVEFLAGMCTVWTSGMVEAPPPSASALISCAEGVAKQLATQAMPPITFESVQRTDRTWSEGSANGLTFTVGRFGLHPVEITLGDELNQRHNMLVTGAVGQGKSNLLSVMIHSLCERYSPTELELYLLDFKEGVTLRAFFDETTGEHLPHARVLGLEADREFGLNVLRHLHTIYKQRMRLFKTKGVQNLHQFRKDSPEAVMPRLLVVVDEFQMMFSEQDQISAEIADLLTKGARLFRACGIHIILASQTIGGNLALMGSAGEGLFAQVPVRIALKNSLSESHATLGIKNDAAAHLRSRQAIVNLDYGEPSSNRKTSIAFADELMLRSRRHVWWRRSMGSVSRPYVFEGDQPRSLHDDASWLRERSETGLVALLGYRIAVDASPMTVSLGRDVGRNIALIGPGAAAVEIASICLSLAMQVGSSAEFIILDMAVNDDFWATHRDKVVASIGETGSKVTVVSRSQVSDSLTDLTERLRRHPDGMDHEVIVVGLGMDRARSIPPEFQDICRNGPPAGLHVIGWWSKLDAFREHVGYGGENYFDTKLALALDTTSTKQLMNDPLLEWHTSDNRALVWDSSEMAAPTRIIPYSRFAPLGRDN